MKGPGDWSGAVTVSAQEFWWQQNVLRSVLNSMKNVYSCHQAIRRRCIMCKINNGHCRGPCDALQYQHLQVFSSKLSDILKIIKVCCSWKSKIWVWLYLLSECHRNLFIVKLILSSSPLYWDYTSHLSSNPTQIFLLQMISWGSQVNCFYLLHSDCLYH